MTPREMIKAGGQYVTYTVFVGTLAIWIAGAQWLRDSDLTNLHKDMQNISSRSDERWDTYYRIETARDERINAQLQAINASIDKLRDMIGP